MQKSETGQAIRVHRKAGTSTTLNRRYVKRPQKGTEALEASVQEAAQVEAIERARQQVIKRSARATAQTGQVRRSPKISRFNDGMVRTTDGVTRAGGVAKTDGVVKAGGATRAGGAVKIDEVMGAGDGAKMTEGAEMAERAQVAKGAQMAKGAQVATKQKRSIKVQDEVPVEQRMEPAVAHPLQTVAMDRMRERNSSQQQPRMSAKEIKNQEIKKALARTSRVIDKDIAKRERDQKRTKLHFGIARVMLAISCAAVAVMAIVYFVNTNMPDISMRVAAVQTGINASYPGYVPRGYSMTDLSSEDGRVAMNFKNDENGDTFSLVEEKSSWDSDALETNYVKEELGEGYTILREQGVTIFVGNNGAAWVNGGVVYKLSMKPALLTKKQITSIATSL